METTANCTRTAAPDYPLIDYAPVARVEAPDVECFRRDHERRNQPVIITGLAHQWRLTRDWSLERLAHTYKASRVACLKLRPDGHLAASPDTPSLFERVRLPDFVESLRSDPVASHYMSAPLSNFTPAFNDELEIPPYCADALSFRPLLWVGGAGTVTPLHFDVAHNLLAQIHGRKRIVIYPRAQTPLLYAHPLWSRFAVVARVDPEAPDLKLFPRFVSARPLGCILEPGEILFIPSLWWHHVRALDASASISFWYGGYKVAAFNAAAALFRRVRGMQKAEASLD